MHLFPMYISANTMRTFPHHIVIKEVPELLCRYPQVSVGEGVRDIPAQWTKEASFLHNGVEKAQREQHATEPF